MIPLRAHAGRRISVLSLDGAGLTAARALAAGGAELTVWDADEARRTEAERAGLTVEDPTTRDWSDLSALVVGTASLLESDPGPRLIEMARALDAPLVAAEALLAEGYSETGRRFTAALGRQAVPALDFAAHLLRDAGQGVIGPHDPDRVREAGPGVHILAAFEHAPVSAPYASCLLDGAGAASDLRALAHQVAGPLVLSADDPSVRRLSVSGLRRASLVSGRAALARGVFVSAGKLIDALDGRAKPVAALADTPACAQANPLALAAGYALARALGLTREAARDGVATYRGCAGYGAPLGGLGPFVLADWSSAEEPGALIEVLKRARPAVWLAEASVDPKLTDLMEASGAAPHAIVMTGDRRRARRRLSRLCPVQVERDMTGAVALAVHAALKAGPGASIVYAPGGPAGASCAGEIARVLDGLMARAIQGDAA